MVYDEFKRYTTTKPDPIRVKNPSLFHRVAVMKMMSETRIPNLNHWRRVVYTTIVA